MNLACRIRKPADPHQPPPATVAQCLFIARGGDVKGAKRLAIGSKDHRFWSVGAYLLDVLDAVEGQLSTAATVLGITTSNFTKVLSQDRHLFTAAQDIRKKHNLKPMT